MRQVTIVGAAGTLSDRDRRVYELDGIEIGVFRLGDEFYAYENRCPHMGGPVCQGRIMSRVEEEIDDEQCSWGMRFSANALNIVCPWHGYEFDIRTGHHQGSERFRLRPVAVERSGADLIVSLPLQRGAAAPAGEEA